MYDIMRRNIYKCSMCRAEFIRESDVEYDEGSPVIVSNSRANNGAQTDSQEQKWISDKIEEFQQMTAQAQRRYVVMIGEQNGENFTAEDFGRGGRFSRASIRLAYVINQEG